MRNGSFAPNATAAFTLVGTISSLFQRSWPPISIRRRAWTPPGRDRNTKANARRMGIPAGTLHRAQAQCQPKKLNRSVQIVGDVFAAPGADPIEPVRSLGISVHQGGAARHVRTAMGPDRQHLFQSASWEPQPGQLFRREGWPDLVRAVDVARERIAWDNRERGCAGSGRLRSSSRAATLWKDQGQRRGKPADCSAGRAGRCGIGHRVSVFGT